MRRFVTRFALAAASLALAACTSTYHPEYHPVTVSNFSQNVAYPVNVHTGVAPAPPPPVYVVPAPPTTTVIPTAPPPPTPPPGFFNPE